jgi:hypothetical protein
MIGNKPSRVPKNMGMNRGRGMLGQLAWVDRPTLWFWAPVAHLLQAFLFRAY